MRLVLDTNVVIAALLRDSTSRRILAAPSHEFLMPEHALSEVDRHLDELLPRMGLSREEAALLLALVTQRVQTIPATEFEAQLPEARRVMRDLDPDDAVFVALALALPCDGIWTNDKALRRQTRVATFTTADVVAIGDGGGKTA